MQRDLGSRDSEFIDLIARIRTELLKIAGVSQKSGYEAILMQGSGTFAIEAVLASVIPPDGRLLVVANGAYGERMLPNRRAFEYRLSPSSDGRRTNRPMLKMSDSCWRRNHRLHTSRSFNSRRRQES